MEYGFIAATGQNAGKTSVALGFMTMLHSRKMKTGFIKPVGQRYVEIDGAKVDEDSVLMKRVFNLTDPVAAMSPIAIPRGFTTDYVNNRETYTHLKSDIYKAFETVSDGKDATIIEGTGHAGVGSIFELSNAVVAKMLDAKVIIVAEGGIGRAIDEIVLNAALFEKYGVEVMGVILNKVREDKYDKVKDVVSKALAHSGLRPLGFLPHREILTLPHIYQLAKIVEGEVISGAEQVDKYIENIVIAAMEAENTLKYITNHTLVITSGDRIDNILVSISSHLVETEEQSEIAGIILTGGITPHRRILELLKRTNIPVIFTKQDTYTVASNVYSLTIKTQVDDRLKIKTIQDLAEEYIDTAYILDALNVG